MQWNSYYFVNPKVQGANSWIPFYKAVSFIHLFHQSFTNVQICIECTEIAKISAIFWLFSHWSKRTFAESKIMAFALVKPVSSAYWWGYLAQVSIIIITCILEMRRLRHRTSRWVWRYFVKSCSVYEYH